MNRFVKPRVVQLGKFYPPQRGGDRKSTRLNSSHSQISYAVFCLKKKNSVEVAAQIINQSKKLVVVFEQVRIVERRVVVGRARHHQLDRFVIDLPHRPAVSEDDAVDSAHFFSASSKLYSGIEFKDSWNHRLRPRSSKRFRRKSFSSPCLSASRQQALQHVLYDKKSRILRDYRSMHVSLPPSKAGNWEESRE